MDQDPYRPIDETREDLDKNYDASQEYYMHDNRVPIPLPHDQYDPDKNINMHYRDHNIYQYNTYDYMEQRPFQGTMMYKPENEYQLYQHDFIAYKKPENNAPLYEYYSSTEGEVFICGVPGCNKRYRTKNGIMYHRKVGCKFEDDDKRFICKYEGCNNKYRGASGLRYHLIHYHNELPRKGKD